MTQPEDNQELEISKVLAEYMHSCDSGPAPNREEFLDMHPELREQLQELLHAADWIEELAGPTIADIAKVKNVDELERSPNDETLPHVGRFNRAAESEQTLPTNAPIDGPRDATAKIASESDPHHGLSGRHDLSQPVLPCQFGDYVLERVLGRGGMGVVYAGRQKNLDRPVAIKMIRSGALASEEEVQRFYAEARSAAQLDHPNIVTVYQCGEENGHRYFSMDFVSGTDLSRLIQDGPVDCRRAARYVRDVARAVQYAHDHGILHRDLKPANVLIDDDDEVHITDFGLAKSIGTETGLTATGAALGTPSYMSPEQAAGKVSEQHHGTDIYSLGAILFTIVTGKPPFKASTVVQTIMHVIHRPAPAARSVNNTVHEDIETIIDVCLQKSPERRYSSAGELADDLDRYLEGTPIQARPMSQIRRAWYWLLGVPIFGAVLDHRVVEPTEAHRWVQRGLISIAMMFVIAWLSMVALEFSRHNRMPGTVRVAAGMAGGGYDKVARTICDSLTNTTQATAVLIPTAGSSENVDLLATGAAELALLQADATERESVRIVAPLYYEAVHILVRKDLQISSLDELEDRQVVVGSQKAGSHAVGKLLLASVGLSYDDIKVDSSDWHLLEQEPFADAAIIVSRRGSDEIRGLLGQGEYTLLPMSMAWAMQFVLDEPAFHVLLIADDHYPECGLEETLTVATTAFLATRVEAPDVLVKNVLDLLFASEVRSTLGVVSAERAAHWGGLAWHPAAREFFARYRGSTPGLD